MGAYGPGALGGRPHEVRGSRELLYSYAASGRYVCTRELARLEPRPFFSCVNRWTIGERYGYMSMAV